jgi:hypothetical protein
MSSRVTRTRSRLRGAWEQGLRLDAVSVRFLGALLLAPVALGLGRALPAEGAGLGLRLAGAFACMVLVPGALVLRAVDWPARLPLAAVGSLAWGLMVALAAFSITFLVGASLDLTILLIAVVSIVALAVVAFRRPPTSMRIERRDVFVLGALLLLGCALAAAVWSVSDVVAGDALFHLGRVRKLVELPALSSLSVVDEFRNGSLHPGYAFPLWHGVLALVAKLAAVDPALVVLHLGAVLVPLALVAFFAAGWAVFGSRSGGIAVVAASLTLVAFARDGVGALEFLAQPGAAGRLLLGSGIVALAFSFVGGGRRSRLLTIGAAALALAIVHVTYAVFIALPLAGFALARLVLVRNGRRDARRMGIALAATLIPSAVVCAALIPLVSSTQSVLPDAAERARGVGRYGESLDFLGDSYSLAPETLTRGGAAFVAAFLAVAAAALARRTRWAAFVVGGCLAVLVALLVPPFFTGIADLASLSQARRLAGFLPLAFALAGGLVALGRLRLLGVLIAAGLGVGLWFAYPGVEAPDGGPQWPVWIAVGAALVILLAARGLRDGMASVTAATTACAVAFTLPLAIVGLADLQSDPKDPEALSPGLVAAIREHVPAKATVLAPLDTSYRIAAYAPVYVAAAPPAHVANTARNQPYARRRNAIRFFYRDDLPAAEKTRILRIADATWLVVDRHDKVPRYVDSLPAPVYSDGRYDLYRLPTS